MAIKKTVAKKTATEDDMFSLGATSSASKRYVPQGTATAPKGPYAVGPSGPMGGPSGPMGGPSGPMMTPKSKKK